MDATDKVFVLVFDLGLTSDRHNIEIGSFGFFWWRWRWCRDIRSGFVQVSKVALANVFPFARFEVIVITSQGHVARDGANYYGNHKDDGEYALNDNDNNPNDGCCNSCQVEAFVKGCGQADCGHLAKTEKVDHKSI
jgi:hypothetical protein